jgi:uncharacterized membrane protein HdeD (DUF308 family)
MRARRRFPSPSLRRGIVAIAAGVLEIGVLILARGWWKLLHGLLVVVSIAAGVVALIHPGDTFAALAAVFSFFLVFAGTMDIIVSISARREIEVWWLRLVGGIIELGLGFWAAGYYGRSAVLLVAWVAAFAIIRGVRDIVFAFRVREVQHAAAG